ncbi:MAG TPA: SPOR domain-containing protein [Prolixibacteraceae bacterium]|nr:SPOR domain-containing protein [Prolixibacteraceae bacterium]
MKQFLKRIALLFCLFWLTGMACHADSIYTVQVAASKTPTDIKWFSAKHLIEVEIVEFKENNWYKYIIGEFHSLNEASGYITQHLASKGLQGPFPRLLPDSLRGHDDRVTQSVILDSSSVKEMETDSVIDKDTLITLTAPARQTAVTHGQRPGDKYEEYGSWADLIGMENLDKLESLIIKEVTPHLPKSWVPFYEKMIDRAFRYPVVLLFMVLIILFILNAIVIVIILELSNTIKNNLGRFDALYTAMYERALTGYIFQEYDMETAVKRIKGIRYERNRKVFIEVLFNFKKNLSGDLEQKLLDISFALGLEKDSIRKTRARSFYRRIIGIRELTNLFPSRALPVVETYINDANDELRAEAQTSYVRLNHEEPFHFLKDLKRPFTRWTQLTSFYIFRLHKLPAPSFVEYLKSDLYNVQNFSLRMIIYFQQKENAQEIIRLLYAKREMTRFLAIRAVNELGIHEAKPLLKEVFGKETYKNRVEIIKGFEHMGEEEDFGFLENIIRQKDVTLKIQACRSMYFMSPSGREYLMSLTSDPELNIEPYIAHIYDPRN